MKAWVVHQFGPYREKLTWGDFEDPETPTEGTKLKILASGLNFPDMLCIAGTYQMKPPLPFVPGNEVVGEVVEAGPKSRFKKGDRVLTMNLTGAFAEYTAAEDSVSFAVPDGMSNEDAAAILVNFQTSYFGLSYRANLKPGETLLVHGGAGGVGTAAIQLGKAAGAKVIATAGSKEKLDICKQCGADEVIDYTKGFVDQVKDLTEGRGADVIYDPIGGDVFDQSTKCIAWEGRILVIGFASGRIPQLAVNRVLLKNCAVVGVFWGNYQIHNPELIKKTQDILFEMYAQKKIKPVIYRVYPRAELIDALGSIESRKAYGKVILGQ